MRKIIVVVLSLFVLVSCGEHNLMDNSSNIYDSPNENLQNEEINKEANTAEHNFFYVTPCGEKYHFPDCSYIQRPLSECRKYTDVEAEEKGYAPCSRCIG